MDDNMRSIDVIAEELAAQRRRIQEITEQELAPSKVAEEELRLELLSALKESRLKSIKSEDGTVFVRSERVNYGIVDKIAALTWAKKNKCVTVDKAAANKILRTKYPNMPKGFEVNVTEFISVKGLKESE